MVQPADLTRCPDLGLNKQVVIVTGGNSGLGRACALAFGQAGASVVVNHLPRSKGAAEEVVKAIEEEGGEAHAIAGDVSKESEVRDLFAATVKRFGTVHILVNNAGIQNGAPFHEMELDQWQQVISVNLTGQFLCAREAVREFLRRGMQPEVSCALGKIICMSSVHQMIPWAYEANYAASKGGVMLLMQSMAQELAHKGVRVNAVAPGAIRTPINREAWETKEAYEELLKLIPQGRIGEPQDIAQVVLWLATDLSDYINGATLFADGGMSLYPAFRGAG